MRIANLKILVEGNNDVQFLTAFVKINFAKMLTNNNFHKIGGWAGLKNHTAQINEFIEDECDILLIIDTDEPNKQGGLAARKQFIEEYKTANQFDFDYYLLPNNNDNGALENLIYDCIPNDMPFKNCWQNYIACLATNPNYHTPANKSMIMSYCELVNGEIDFKKVDLANTNNFDLQNPPSAKVLKTFLSKFIK